MGPFQPSGEEHPLTAEIMKRRRAGEAVNGPLLIIGAEAAVLRGRVEGLEALLRRARPLIGCEPQSDAALEEEREICAAIDALGPKP